MDKAPKSIKMRQIPFLTGGTITGAIRTYYYGFMFTIIVNSIIWWLISYVASKLIWKTTGLNDQKYLIQYFLLKSKLKDKRNVDFVVYTLPTNTFISIYGKLIDLTAHRLKCLEDFYLTNL